MLVLTSQLYLLLESYRLGSILVGNGISEARGNSRGNSISWWDKQFPFLEPPFFDSRGPAKFAMQGGTGIHCVPWTPATIFISLLFLSYAEPSPALNHLISCLNIVQHQMLLRIMSLGCEYISKTLDLCLHPSIKSCTPTKRQMTLPLQRLQPAATSHHESEECTLFTSTLESPILFCHLFCMQSPTCTQAFFGRVFISLSFFLIFF